MTGTPSTGPPSTGTDLIVVGAGPAGRALAHRAAGAGLRVLLIDPDPHRPWRATYGLFADEAPAWLAPGAVATRSAGVTVFTPRRRTIARGYLVLDPDRFQRSLSLDGVEVLALRAHRVTAGSVRLADGTLRTARCVVDARGTAERAGASLPRQTAFGRFVPDRGPAAAEPSGEDPSGEDPSDEDPSDEDPGAVLMDWRPADEAAAGRPSFSYRVGTARGRLIQETCLAGSPPLPIAELARRGRLRGRDAGTPAARAEARPAGGAPADTEIVDFPLYADRRPWRGGGAVRFGAAGGMMHPATGYSVAQSLGAVDTVVTALRAGDDPAARLWGRRARAVYRLRLIGLAVLLTLEPAALIAFFDAFFALPVARQRAYLTARTDLPGTVAAMAAVFVRCPARLRVTIAVATGRAAWRLRTAG